MFKRLSLCLLLTASFALSSCGSQEDDIVLVNYVVTVTAGDIEKVVYLDSDGMEQQTLGETGKKVWTKTISAKDGDFVLLNAESRINSAPNGGAVSITARILVNGVELTSTTGAGTDGVAPEPDKWPVVTADGIAVLPATN